MSVFHTLDRNLEITGIGLHSGALVTARLEPRAEPGITFVREDVPGTPEVPASIEFVTTTTHATTLARGEASVSTTEHLLAALWTQDVTHCRVVLNGPEVPIVDGSAAPWIELLRQAQLVPLPGERPVYGLSGPVWVDEAGASVLGVPLGQLRVSVAVDFGHPHAGPQAFDTFVTAGSFAAEVAPARTFTLEQWLGALQNAGLIRGGSEECALVLREEGPSSPWRMPLEIARHKTLDAIGDLALGFAAEGAAFVGHLTAIRAGHGPHRRWMEACRESGALIRLR
jgi:UDP-3-O-[3-hydroxymyristoyl] N-acetylglucosamine deacetylase